jgi:hypothetical protein
MNPLIDNCKNWDLFWKNNNLISFDGYDSDNFLEGN